MMKVSNVENKRNIVSDEQLIKAFCIFYNTFANDRQNIDANKAIDNYHKNVKDKQIKTI